LRPAQILVDWVMSTVDVLEEVLEIIPNSMFPKKYENVHELSLEKDLGIYGDDAVEIIFKLSDKFKIDISQLDFSKYFFKEHEWLKRWITYKFGLSNKKIKLTIGDLEKAVHSKVLL